MTTAGHAGEVRDAPAPDDPAANVADDVAQQHAQHDHALFQRHEGAANGGRRELRDVRGRAVHGEAAAQAVDPPPEYQHRQAHRGVPARLPAHGLHDGARREEHRRHDHLAARAEAVRDPEHHHRPDERAAHTRRGDGALHDGVIGYGVPPRHAAPVLAHQLREHVRRRADVIAEQKAAERGEEEGRCRRDRE